LFFYAFFFMEQEPMVFSIKGQLFVQ
jgi:hypothetical protein